MTDIKRLGKIAGVMMLIFIATGILSSLLMIIGVSFYPPALGVDIPLKAQVNPQTLSFLEQLVKALSVPDFIELLSKKNMLALIVFSLLVGLAASRVRDRAQIFISFLKAGYEVMLKVISYMMLYAPIGLGAYFAYLVGTFGTELMGSYWRVILLYYPVAIAYFIVGFSFYAYLAGGFKAIKTFWSNIIPTSLTAWGTGSSIATIPVNLEAAEKIGIPKDIRELVIPIGATAHMDGSCLSAIVKIAFLFGLFHMDFTSPPAIAMAVVIALLSGVVMSGIPSGGFLGELLIVTFYGFPIEALPLISMIGTLVDPPATMVNAVGDNVASMLVARVLNGKKWMGRSEEN